MSSIEEAFDEVSDIGDRYVELKRLVDQHSAALLMLATLVSHQAEALDGVKQCDDHSDIAESDEDGESLGSEDTDCTSESEEEPTESDLDFIAPEDDDMSVDSNSDSDSSSDDE